MFYLLLFNVYLKQVVFGMFLSVRCSCTYSVPTFASQRYPRRNSYLFALCFRQVERLHDREGDTTIRFSMRNLQGVVRSDLLTNISGVRMLECTGRLFHCRRLGYLNTSSLISYTCGGSTRISVWGGLRAYYPGACVVGFCCYGGRTENGPPLLIAPNVCGEGSRLCCCFSLSGRVHHGWHDTDRVLPPIGLCSLRLGPISVSHYYRVGRFASAMSLRSMLFGRGCFAESKQHIRDRSSLHAKNYVLPVDLRLGWHCGPSHCKQRGNTHGTRCVFDAACGRDSESCLAAAPI